MKNGGHGSSAPSAPLIRYMVLKSPTVPAGDTARRAAALGLLLVAFLVAAATAPAASDAAACTPPVVNQVACENTKAGTDPNTWEIAGAGDLTLQGFATSMSVDQGQTVSFKIQSANAYRVDILRLGYYGGLGARLVAANLVPAGTGTQPACGTDSSSGLIDCGNWSTSVSWNVPSSAVSGVYIAHLKRTDGVGDGSHIPFVVRNDAGHSDVVVQTSDATWQAYNGYGGNSLYKCVVACPPGNPQTYKAAFKVSYNRPMTTENDSPLSALFNGAEYPMIRFLEASGYDASYVSQVDVESSGALLKNHKLYISSGHDEYWSSTQRSNVEAARDAGVNLAFFSGNEIFWKTRYEPSADGTNTPRRTLVSYKDTHFDARTDPVAWTGTWRDSRFLTPADGITPENSLTGQSFVVNSGTSDITVPYEHGRLRMWRNTAAASLAPGGRLRLAPSTLGYEWDVDADNGFRPAGQFRLSSTTVSGLELFSDYGSNVEANGTATHNLVMYRAASGARVFGAGTVQWAYGLDDANPENTPADRNMQQATMNLFADMGVQPFSLLPGLVAAAASSDNTAPTSTLTSPPAVVADGANITLTGTATDAGGGVVAGVEVSTDGGASWHPATGTSNWTYTWIAHGSPSTTIKWRAVDDSANLQVAGAGVSVNVSCPCSLWGSNVVPAAADAGDPTPVELGVKFTSDAFGVISGVRFYKAAANTGTHTGSLWTADGQRLAQATFTGESATGWQTATFDTPVQVLPDTTYIASYFAPNGHYSATPAYFYPSPAPGPNGGATHDSKPLHAVRDSGATRNGMFRYSSGSTFPADSYSATNYWVDPLFTAHPVPGQASGVTASAAGPTSAYVAWSAPTSGGPVTGYRVTPYIGSTPQTSKTVSGSPVPRNTRVTGLTTGSTYTFRVEALNPNGAGPASQPSNAVTPVQPVPPSEPTDVSVVGGSHSVRVSWTESESDGESPITSHDVTPYIGAVPQDAIRVGGSDSSVTIPDLENGTTYTFKVTSTNAAGTSPSSAASVPVMPYESIFETATPAVPDSGDTFGVELGVNFRADFDGTVTGIRFYKSVANTGTHTGSLWTAGGQRLAQVTFTNETASGWQVAAFDSPVAVQSGTTYVASYHAPRGHYAFTSNGLGAGVENPPLRALSNATTPNGLYSYGDASTFPNNNYDAANYSVDVMFAMPRPGRVTGATAAEAGRTSATVSWSAPSAGGPVTSYEITPWIGSSPQAPRIVSGSPPATQATIAGLTTGTTYTFAVRAVNPGGSGAWSDRSNAVTPQTAVAPSAPIGVTAVAASKSASVSWIPSGSDGDSPITRQTVTPYIGSQAQTPVEASATATSATISGLTNGTSYRFRVSATNDVGTSQSSAPSAPAMPYDSIFEQATPDVADAGDSTAVELGVKFSADLDGAVTGIRFYKSAENTGTHTGSLWTASGQRLAQVTFTSETPSGWQLMAFDAPVAVTANTTYVASYHAPRGHYPLTGGLAAGVNRPPLRALSNATSANGVFAYSSTPVFPANSFNASNYLVDVMYAAESEPGEVTGVAAVAGRTSASVSWTAPASGGAVASYEVTPYIGSQPQPPKTVTGSPPATQTTIGGLTAGTAYTFTVRAVNPSGTGPVSNPSNAVTPLAPVAPSAPTGVSAEPDIEAASVSWNEPSSDGGAALTGYVITPYAGATAQPPVEVGASTTSTRITDLIAGTSYTFKVAARNGAGTGTASADSNAVKPRASIFGFGTPPVLDSGDYGSAVLGMKFTSDVAGTVTGVRFYKAASNTGIHVGSVWSASGQLLAQVTFTGETASGWQTATFDTPVAITAGTTYVSSYLAPQGHYSLTGAGFASNGIDKPPLHAVGDAISPNGVYAYSGTSVFPTNSFNATNYWVDVLFVPGS
jgi:hypothetical protein